MALFFLLFRIVFVLLLSPLCVGIIRTVKARMQNRHGASIVQPYRNLIKLFHKDEVVSHDASWIFMIAPYIVFTSTLLIASSIPIVPLQFFAPAGDILIFIYAIALGIFFLALSGLDPASAFGGTGSSREMTLATIAEGGLLFTLLVVAVRVGSTNLGTIAVSMHTIPFTHYLPILIAFFGFFIVLLSENARYPFDNPATHLELTMVHEAMILEYSGKRLALMELASANKLFIFLIIAATIFLPGLSTATTFFGLLMTIAFTLAKAFLLAVGIAVLESSIPKLRYFRLPNLLFTSFAISVIALIIVLII